MGRFALLLRERPGDFADYDQNEFARILGDYLTWRDALERDGRLVGSQKLTYEGGRRLRRRNGTVRVTDGPYSEAKEVVGGVILIEADDYEHAVRIASTCPHLVHSQSIDVRAIDDLETPEGATSI